MRTGVKKNDFAAALRNLLCACHWTLMLQLQSWEVES